MYGAEEGMAALRAGELQEVLSGITQALKYCPVAMVLGEAAARWGWVRRVHLLEATSK